jgi:hypothetical protein
MRKTNLFFIVPIIGIWVLINTISCSSTTYLANNKYKKLTKVELSTIDTLLLYALDNEALYTLLDTLKPISSIKMYRLPLLSSNQSQKDSAVNTLIQLQKIAQTLSNKQFQFILNPFERADSIYKNIELYVVRTKMLNNKIMDNNSFYNTIGVVANTLPQTVLAITEYEQKYTRWRSYGYLFGYPNYAVDFFVEAGKQQDSTKQFVTRDFFHIPVFSGNTGHFTYAMPKGNIPSSVDSALYYKASKTLSQYKLWRKNILNQMA